MQRISRTIMQTAAAVAGRRTLSTPVVATLLSSSRRSFHHVAAPLFLRSSSSSLLFSSSHDSHAAHHGGTDFLSRENVERRVTSVLKSIEKVDKTKLNDINSSFKSLGLDSLDEVEVVMMLEDEFVIDIQDEVASNILTIQDAINYITNHPFAANDEVHH